MSQASEASESAPSESEKARPAQGKKGRPARLEALLTDLGAQIRRGVEPRREPDRVHPTGIVALDGLLPGGFPAGQIGELFGPASSGRTAIALALLAETTEARCELAALVDAADAFDPPSAEAAGVDLDRMLWVRPGGPLEALRCTERLMETGGLPLVLLDLSPPSPAAALPSMAPSATALGRRSHTPRRRRSPAPGAPRQTAISRPALHHWIRLARLADATRTALVVLSRERLTGSQAAFALEARGLQRDSDHSRDPIAGPLETSIALVRARGTPADRTVPLRLETDPINQSVPPLRLETDPAAPG